jgi:hypothetical protein
MKQRFFTFVLMNGMVLSLTSCAMYQQDFDYSPPRGVPCTSQTDLEKMIIETDKGPDLFVPTENESDRIIANRKVWICPYTNEEGCRFMGHYICQKQTLL